MVSDYFYKLYFGFLYLGVQCGITLYRSGIGLLPDDNDARTLIDAWGDDIDGEGSGSAPIDIIRALQGSYGTTTFSVNKYQFMYYRQGLAAPLVRGGVCDFAGMTGVTVGQIPSAMNSISYYAPASEYRRRGAGFRLPVPHDDWMIGNGINPVSIATSSLGDDVGSETTSLLEILNTLESYTGWSGGGSVAPSFPAVVRRVPNSAPEGNGNGTRLPTFAGDVVDVAFCNSFGYSLKVGSQESRRQ